MKRFPRKNNDGGFTLIEVMIAVVVLAIFTLPLMGYFTHALQNAAKGKSIQKCEMAAQSVLDEVNSFNTYAQIDAAVAATGSSWSVDSPTVNNIKYLKRNIEVNGDKMVAKVAFDFNYEHPVTPSAILYNDYQVPLLKTLYCDSSVVAVEEKQSETAVAKFFYKYHESVSQDAIRDAMIRNMEVYISPSTDDPKILDVKVTYLYHYQTEAYETPALVDTQIALADFKNLYILYDAHSSLITSEVVHMSVSGVTTAQASKWGIYFIRQDSPIALAQGASFYLNIQPGAANTISVASYTYYTNGYGCSIGNYKNNIVSHELRERIAHVTVELYKADETEFNTSTRLVQVTSSKGE